MITLVLSLAACKSDQPPVPEKIQGLWELHQVETEGGEVDALDTVLARYPGCTWGRMTWSFEEDHLEVGHDVLCPGESNTRGADPTAAPPTEAEYYGCEVAARVPAVWSVNGAVGSWKVEYPVAVRSRTVGRGDDALSIPTSCEVTLAAGEYPVARVRNHDWRWEMRTPDGTVYRLRLPESDRPDFVAAIRNRGGGQPDTLPMPVDPAPGTPAPGTPVDAAKETP